VATLPNTSSCRVDWSMLRFENFTSYSAAQGTRSFSRLGTRGVFRTDRCEWQGVTECRRSETGYFEKAEGRRSWIPSDYSRIFAKRRRSYSASVASFSLVARFVLSNRHRVTPHALCQTRPHPNRISKLKTTRRMVPKDSWAI